MNGIDIYTKFKKSISNYLAWFKFMQLSKENKKSDLVKGMIINMVTKDTYIIRVTIRKRFDELT